MISNLDEIPSLYLRARKGNYHRNDIIHERHQDNVKVPNLKLHQYYAYVKIRSNTLNLVVPHSVKMRQNNPQSDNPKMDKRGVP
ncbi:hypothetical protein D3C78_1717500 [compost metagenome]